MTFSSQFVTLLNIRMAEEEINKVKTLPIIPIRDGVVFPNTEIVLTFGRPRSLAAIEASNSTDRNVVLVMQKTPHLHEPTPSDLFTIGTIARIERLLKTDGEINALVKGIKRVEILSFESADPLTRYYLSVTTLNKLEAIKRLNALEIFPVDQKRWLTPDSESMEPVQFFEENLNDNSKKKRIQV